MTVPPSVPVNPAYANGIGKGWWPLVEELHKRLTRLDRNYTVQQVKEKFGTLRYYYEPTDDDTDFAYAMREVVRFAEQMSARICETCGAPGKTWDDLGWLLTLCDEHHSQHLTAKRGWP
jgi:hypothetical protein